MSICNFKKWLISCLRRIRINGFLLLCVAVTYVVGYQIGFRSWSQQVSVLINPKASSARGLASTDTERERQIASVNYSIYSDVQNIFKNAQIVSSGDVIQFFVGNVLYNDQQGNQQFICDSFSKVRLVFEAYRVSMEGEKVLMQVVAPCKKYSDFKFIGPFNIPRKAIRKAPISLTDFEEEDETIHFHNVSISWPKSWIFVRAEFLGSLVGLDLYRIQIKPPQSEEEVFLINL